jgi:hypothetical protein
MPGFNNHAGRDAENVNPLDGNTIDSVLGTVLTCCTRKRASNSFVPCVMSSAGSAFLWINTLM